MDIRLAIFDFDGTLADTAAVIVATMQETMRQLGLPVANERTCKDTIGIPLKAGFRQIFPELPSDRLDCCVDLYRDIFNRNKDVCVPQLFPGVKDTLKEFNTRRMDIAIASSRSSVSLRDLTAQLGIAQYIECIIGAEDVENAKPCADPALKAMAAFAAAPEHTVVVGDMPVDILMGKAAGAYTCGVSYGNATLQQLSDAGADFVIDHIGELMHLF